MESAARFESNASASPGTRAVAARILAAVAFLLAVPVFLLVAGALLPKLPVLGIFGAVFATLFTLHLTLVALFALFLALAARHYRSRKFGTTIAVFAALAFLGSLFPLTALTSAAKQNGASISWSDHFRAFSHPPKREPSESSLFATIDGKQLYVDVYPPTKPVAEKSAPVLMLHGGGYIQGHRGDYTNHWDAWLADRGYTVFDADYRLAPPVTWNIAAQDAACAASWIQSHAADLHVDPDRLLISGQSAGAGLALQVAYGVGDGTVKSSCGGTVPQPKAVFAIYPPEDFELGWNLNTALGGMSARSVEVQYLGGSPQQFPDRYRAVSAIYHVRTGLPPTLITGGDHDHLVPYGGHLEIIDALNKVGVPNQLVTIPYGEHGYDLLWNSLGAQTTRHAAAHFLDRYLPATAQSK